MTIDIVFALDAVEAIIVDGNPPQRAMLVFELMENVAENGGIVAIPGTVFQTLVGQGKEQRDRLLRLISDPDSIVVVPPLQVTETLEIAEIAASHLITPDLAHALILARDSGAGLATFDTQTAEAVGLIQPDQIFEI
ncbi:MAG TPA: hypothetical protein VF062_05780 [Candidatus Limnocylindrales bacterium]